MSKSAALSVAYTREGIRLSEANTKLLQMMTPTLRPAGSTTWLSSHRTPIAVSLLVLHQTVLKMTLFSIVSKSASELVKMAGPGV